MAERRLPIAFGVVLLLGLLAARGIPWLTHEREVIAATPTPNAISAVSPIGLEPRAQACTSPVTYSPQSEVARFVVRDKQKGGGPPLLITAHGPGYKTSAQLPGGYPGAGPAEVPLKTPRSSLLGEFCIRNMGDKKVELAGTEEGRTVGRTSTAVNGAQVSAQLSLTFRRAEPAALGSRIGALFRHDAAFNPMTPLLLWILAIALLVLVPVGTFWALSAGFASADAAAAGAGAATPGFPFAAWLGRSRRRLAPAATRVATLPAWVWLAVAFASTAVWLYVWASRTHSFQNDEMAYVYQARWIDTGLPHSLWDFDVVRTGIQRLNILILAPIVGLFGGPEWARIGHVVNVLLWTSTAIPVYLLVRGLRVAGRWALLAAGLTVFVPWAVVATSFLTEPVAYPAWAFAIWAIWRCVTRPSWRADLLAVALVAVAGVARVNLLALAAVLVVAVVAQELRFGGGRPVRERAAAFARAHLGLVAAAGLVLLVLLLSAAGAVSGADRLFGFYGLANRFHVPTQLLTSKLDVYTTRFIAGFAFVPFAFGLAWAVQTLFRPRDPERFAFVAIGVLAIASIIYTSAGAGFDERYIIYYAPLFAVAFAVALADRDTKPVLVGAAGLVGALLLLSQTWSTSPQGAYSWFVSPAETIYANVILQRIGNDLPSPAHARDVAFVLTLGVVALCMLAASRHRSARTAMGFLIAGVVATQLFQTQDAISRHVNGAGSRAAAGDAARSWVDEAIYGKSHAAILAVNQGNTTAIDPIWAELQFWNDSVSSVVTVGTRGIQVPPSDTYAEARIDPDTGRLETPSLAPYVVLQRGFTGVGFDARVVKQASYLALDLVQLRSRNIFWTASGMQLDGYMDPGRPVAIKVYRHAVTGAGAWCAHADVFAPSGLKTRATLTGPDSRQTKPVPATTAVRVEIPVRFGTRPSLDLTLSATGKVPLADGRIQSVQIAGIGVEKCPPGIGP
ncbi:MAG TPA: hypothetical protein VF066_10135 [Thermoleophilaceae bacterium]